MLLLQREAAVIAMLLGLVASMEVKNFRKFKFCKGGDVCSKRDPFFSIPASDIFQPPATTSRSSCLPNAVKCAFWCQASARCLGFNYFSVGTCAFFEEYSFIVYPLSGCVYYEIDKATLDSYNGLTNLALRRKTCQSSAAIVNNTMAGAWLLLFSQPICAQTQETTSASNWWMIDLEHPIKLAHVILRTGNFAERLLNTIVSVTNNSWEVAKPVRGSEGSICCIIKDVGNHQKVDVHCDPSIQSGRYVVIQPEYADGHVILCEFQAYPSLN